MPRNTGKICFYKDTNFCWNNSFVLSVISSKKHHHLNTFANHFTEAQLQETSVPIPAAYTRHLSYKISKDSQFNHHVFNSTKEVATQFGLEEVDSLHEKEPSGNENGEVSTAKKRSSLLIHLRDSRIYLRVVAVLIMIVSLSLILSAVVLFSKAQNKPGHPLNSIPQPSTGITVS